MTAIDYAERLAADPVFRFAMLGGNVRTAVESIGPHYIAYDRRDNWIYGAGDDPDAALDAAWWSTGYTQQRELLVSRASAKLASVIRVEGVGFPGFWRRVKGIARHESELLRPQAIRCERRAIRPPTPAWKRR